jgi:hypothetical protein
MVERGRPEELGAWKDVQVEAAIEERKANKIFSLFSVLPIIYPPETI